MVFWLPRYYRDSKVTMRVESTRKNAMEAFWYFTKLVKSYSLFQKKKNKKKTELGKKMKT